MKKQPLKFIGVTGTNGKTTTTFLIYHLLKKMAQRACLIGTVKYIIGSKEYKPTHTTPDSAALEGLIKKIKKEGVKFVVMEVSSHGIVQERIKQIIFSRCVFTNLSREHLDYHKTMKNYFKAKEKLFLDNKAALSLINIDDNYGRKIFKRVTLKLSYAICANADFRAQNISLTRKGSQFDIIFSGKLYPVTTNLYGRHNVLNILGAVSVVHSLGFSIPRILKYVVSFKSVKGRLEQITKDVFVDYAHTPDALRKVLLAVRNMGYEKIICVFGCGGDRDKGKRKAMGQIAAKYANFTFITSDNPRNEGPLEICLQIEKGFKKKNYSIVSDRKRAIEAALKLFDERGCKKSCVLIAGKGHENYQITENRTIPFNDSKVVKEILKK